jgi:hypothetical protein
MSVTLSTSFREFWKKRDVSRETMHCMHLTQLKTPMGGFYSQFISLGRKRPLLYIGPKRTVRPLRVNNLRLDIEGRFLSVPRLLFANKGLT